MRSVCTPYTHLTRQALPAHAGPGHRSAARGARGETLVLPGHTITKQTAENDNIIVGSVRCAQCVPPTHT